MSYDQAYEIGRWIGIALLVIVGLWVMNKIGEYRHRSEQEAAKRREAIRLRKAQAKN